MQPLIRQRKKSNELPLRNDRRSPGSSWIYDVRREDDALIVTTYDDVYRIKPDSSAKHLDLIQKVDAKPVLDTRYASTHIGDALWDLTPNGLQICTPPLREESERSASLEGGQATQYDLPERFVSIYYESDENLIYLTETIAIHKTETDALDSRLASVSRH